MELNPCYFSSKRSRVFFELLWHPVCFRASAAEVNFVVVNLSRGVQTIVACALCDTSSAHMEVC